MILCCRWQWSRFDTNGTNIHVCDTHIGHGEKNVIHVWRERASERATEKKNKRQTKWAQFITFTTQTSDDIGQKWSERKRKWVEVLRKLMLWFSHFHWAHFPNPKDICKGAWLNKDNNHDDCSRSDFRWRMGVFTQFGFDNWLGCKINVESEGKNVVNKWSSTSIGIGHHVASFRWSTTTDRKKKIFISSFRCTQQNS